MSPGRFCALRPLGCTPRALEVRGGTALLAWCFVRLVRLMLEPRQLAANACSESKIAGVLLCCARATVCEQASAVHR